MAKLDLNKAKPEKANKVNNASPKKYFLLGFVAASTMLVIFLAIIAVAYLFDISEFKSLAIKTLRIDQEQQQRLEQREEQVNKILEEIDFDMEEIEQEKSKLSLATTEISEREIFLYELEKKLQEKQIEIENIVSIYEEMDEQLAANILSINPESKETSVIIKNLPEKKAAKILGFMDPQIAAKILVATEE